MEKKVSVWQATLNSGLILGLALVIYTLLLYFLDQTFNKSLGYVSPLIFIIGLILGIKKFRDDARGGVMSYGQGIGAGTVIGLYAGIIGAIFTFLLYKVIDPDLMGKLIIESGRVPEKMIDQVMEQQNKFLLQLVIFLGGIFSYVLFGVIDSFYIAGIFLKKEGDAYQKDMAAIKDIEKPDLTQKPPKTWLVESILVTLFSCLPFGIAGIVNAAKVKSRFYAGDYDGANRASEQAVKWTKIGFWIGLVSIVIHKILLISGVIS